MTDPASEDRLLDSALDEVLGGHEPPDLRDAIEQKLALGNAPIPIRRLTDSPRHRSRRPLLAGMLAGAAATLAVAAWYGLWSTPTLARTVEVAVETGSVAQWEDRRWVPKPPAGRDSFVVVVGDLLRAGVEERTQLRLGSLGVLTMSSLAGIEVVDMKWNDFGRGAALGSITVAVISGGIYWVSGGASARAEVGDQLVLERGDKGGRQLSVEEEAELRNRLEQAEAQVAELESAAARRRVSAPVEVAETTPDETAPTADPAAAAPRFHYTGLDAALANVDWSVIGEATVEMVPLLAEVLDTIDSGGELPLELAGKIQALNAKLLGQAQAIVDGKIPGEGVNGSFTHPVVVANQLGAMFDAAAMPLTDGQTASLQELAARYAGEDDQRRTTYPHGTPRLKVLIEELALKDRFYREARGLLTPEQLAVISHPSTAGHTGVELVGTGVAWTPFVSPVRASNAAEYGSSLTHRFASDFGLSDAVTKQVGTVVESWAAQLPAALWEPVDPARAQLNFYATQRLDLAARAQLVLIEQLLDSVPLTAAQRSELLKVRSVLVPLPR